jgi:glycosyltransferase involved in cell wall biosynthesis
VKTPSVSVVVPAYNAERHVAETLSAILSQSHPPDEVIVVDDGSTDGTADELARFRGEVQVLSQANRGAAGAHNTGFTAARGTYVARCDADDVWGPDKLERQLDVVRTHPEVDIALGAAWVFGREERLFAEPPGEGILDERAFRRTLYRANVVCASSALIRRDLFEKLGPFADRLPCEDYDYWLRAAKAGAVFFYDPGVLLRYRQHAGNVTNNALEMCRSRYLAHTWHADVVDDRRLVRAVLAQDCADLGRLLVDADRHAEARSAFSESLRHRPGAFALAWTLLVSVPPRYRRALIGASISLKRRVAVPQPARR